ncbi:MAG TPA: uracil-DNA glycosylase [Bacteroidota bacterium]|nr:uracil-DNA glycosylase [Bacteroidota bacterium]
MSKLQQLQQTVVECRKCPRLVAWREKAAREKVKRFANETYWGRPLPSFGDPDAQLLLVGLAPAAHGGNRTGRMFTGDRSGDWLFRALYKSGFANQPESLSLDDGLKLRNCYITAACRCAPPQNKLLSNELQNCRSFLLEELLLLNNLRIIVGLGKTGFDVVLQSCERLGWIEGTQNPKFGHGVEFQINKTILLIGSYHPSQQNTFTGKLTEPMFDKIFRRTQRLLNES